MNKVLKYLLNVCFYAFIVILICHFCIKIFDIKLVMKDFDISIQSHMDEEWFNNQMQSKEIIFIENNIETKYTLKDLNITYTIDECNYSNFVYYDGTIYAEYDTSNLSKSLEKLNINRTENILPRLVKENNKIKIKAYQQGNLLDIDALSKEIERKLNWSIIRIDLEEFYLITDTIELEKELNKELEKLNTSISYTNGYEIKVLDYIDYLKIFNNQIVFNHQLNQELSQKIDETIEKELLSYDTVGQAKEFITTNNETIEVSGGTYGNIFSSNEETKYILHKFYNFESEENRIPIMSLNLGNEIPNTYIEISINDQYLWYYVDGELLLESKIVTGTYNRHDTPKGVYYISECINGKYLVGDDYKTWVNKWMRITNQGHGLHDATWRSRFGGTIYKYNGSHGCINLPYNFAKQLYDKVEVNTVVVIY